MPEQQTHNPDSQAREGRLKITEIFHSLQGEALQAGLPTVFIRLTGCPLRCVYCDSEYAFHGGKWLHIDDIVAEEPLRISGHSFRTVPDLPLYLRGADVGWQVRTDRSALGLQAVA